MHDMIVIHESDIPDLWKSENCGVKKTGKPDFPERQ